MFAIRTILASTIIFAAMPPASVRAASDSVQYVGGTVKSIPVNTAGALHFDDAKVLRFSYNGSVYSVPYDQIMTTDIQKVTDVRRVLHIFPVVSPLASHRHEILVISYTDASGASGSLNFEMPAYMAEGAEQTIAAKKTPGPLVNPLANTTWWGDKYWKTTRNQAQWEVREAQAAQAAQKAQSSENVQTAAPVQPGELAGGTK